MWLEKAAENGWISAMTSLAHCLETGYGCAKDRERAIHWYEKAAMWGDVKASERLLTLLSGSEDMGAGYGLLGGIAPAA